MEEQKKIYATADVLFSSLKIGEEQKKIYAVTDVLFFADIQHGAKQNKKCLAQFMIKVNISVSAHGRHKMVCRLHFAHPCYSAKHSNPSTGILFTLLHNLSKKLVANYAIITKLKMINQKIQYSQLGQVHAKN